MKALMYKDWICYRWAYLFLGGLAMFEMLLLPAVGVGVDYVMRIVAAMFFIAGVTMGAGAQFYDLKTHSDRYILAATVKKSTIITQRYLSGWIWSVAATLLLAGSMYFTELKVPKLLIAAMFFFAVAEINALTIPFAHLLGPEKALVPLIILVMLLVSTGAGFAVGTINSKEIEQAAKLFILSMVNNADLIAWVLLVGAIVLNVISYYASLAIYRHKSN